MIVKWLLHGC